MAPADQVYCGILGVLDKLLERTLPYAGSRAYKEGGRGGEGSFDINIGSLNQGELDHRAGYLGKRAGCQQSRRVNEPLCVMESVL